ncbi:MAG TPA: ArgE/DapE family deacylase [Blastocatellia bacterium]|jgi:acetylornithine deacetylase/succinyl-diaminopimelate desuccinylase family protein
MESKFLKHVDRDEIVEIVNELVRHETVNPPGNEYLCKEIVTRCMNRLGMEVSYYEKEPGRTNVVGRMGNGSRSIGFVSHMDVVPPGEMELWETPPFEPTIKDGRIYGRGTLDDKGSFACAYSACKAFIAEHPSFDGTIYLIAAADEEMGSELGIIYLVEECGLRFDVAIIPDGGRMDLSIYGEKGILWVELSSAGVQAHGSTPELGRNAILPLAEALAEIKTLDLGTAFDPAFPDGWTMNVGTIHGGSSTNTVPAMARATIDFRLPAGISKEDVVAKITEKLDLVRRRSPEAELSVKVLHETRPHVSDKNSIIIRSFDRAARRLEIPMKYETFGGNTVAKNLYFSGITSVVHYPGDDKLAHVPNEYVIIDELVLGSVLYAETLEAYFYE